MRKRDITLFLVIVLLWGTGAIAGKYTLMSFSPFFAVALRFFIASAILRFFTTPQSDFKNTFFVSLFISGSFALYMTALKFIDAGTLETLMKIQLPLNVFFAYLLLGEKMDKKISIAFFVSLIGVYIVSNNISIVHLDKLYIVLACIVAGALGNIFIKKSKLSPINLNCNSLFVGSMMMLSLALAFEPNAIEQIKTAKIESWCSIIYTSIVLSVFAQLMWYYLLKKYSMALISIFIPLNLVVTMVLSNVMLGEVISSDKIIGASIIIASLIIAQFDMNKIKAARRINKAKKSAIRVAAE